MAYKSALLAAILLFLFIPLLQNTLHLKKWIKPLKGAYTPVRDTTFSYAAWFSGGYQEAREEYLNQNFGLRNYYVRLNNQIDYSLFRKANADKVVIGIADFLYETDYIEAYYGLDFIGEEKLRERLKKIKKLQEMLKDEGKVLEIVFAPGKATFYPEYIPQEWRYEKKLNNYEATIEICKDLSIDFIDCNAWFLRNKHISAYDLYPRTGIHWSNYWALLVTDSLRKHIERRLQINMRDIVINNVVLSDSLRDPDKDIGDAMNLLRDIKPFPMAYAEYSWGDEGNPVRPEALFIGDSYFWNSYYEGLINNLYAGYKFLYYYNTVYPETAAARDVENLNMEEELSRAQVVVLIATDCHIQDIGWGFIDRALEILSLDKEGRMKKRLYMQEKMHEIRGNPDWMRSIEQKAKENNISVDEMIRRDAEWFYKQENAEEQKK